MALTASVMLPLGFPLPHFTLRDTDGKAVSSDEFKNAPALLVMFMCNHCPYVKHIRSVLASLTDEYMAKGVAVIGISANDVTTHPQDSPANMALEAKSAGYRFPYLYDETQEVAKAFRAACTPEFYLFGKDRTLAYRGRMDGATPGNNVPVSGAELRSALDAVLSGTLPSAHQKPGMGCNIKWKRGNEPDYLK